MIVDKLFRRRFVFDIEADNLLDKVTVMWCIVLYDIDSQALHKFRPREDGWKPLLGNARMVIGHNILGYDLPALKKLFGFEIPKDCRVRDTLIMSQVLDYRRFGHDGHSLRRWGEYLGFPKTPFEDFSRYSEDMLDYCEVDVLLNVRVHQVLIDELEELKVRAPKLPMYLKCEQAAASWCASASLGGWPFDIHEAQQLQLELAGELKKAYNALESKLGMKAVPKDKSGGVVISKEPKWVKSGAYDSHTARWFDVDPWSGFEGEERMIDGEYSRVTFEPLSLDSVTDVKIFLFRNNWVPTTYNTKRDPETGKFKTTSPKITEDSLEFLGGDGKLYLEFLTVRSRFNIIKTWLANVDEDSMLHGDCMVIGTPSMRARHSIIVNVPGSDAAYGNEMRSLFRAHEGWALIGCDSAGNQVRGLAHYLGDPVFIDTLLNGDIHQYNADVLTNVLNGMGEAIVVKRSSAKRILYAFLFGASGGKLWSYIFGNIDPKKGNKLKNGFLKAVPGFQGLLDKLNRIFGSTSKIGPGYIPSLAGNRIYVDSTHKLLVYLLQACEKITCSAALMLIAERLEAEGIPYQPCIFMHDEVQFMTPKEYAERAGEIGRQAFIDGPKLFGVEIMDGESKIGLNWHDTH